MSHLTWRPIVRDLFYRRRASRARPRQHDPGTREERGLEECVSGIAVVASTVGEFSPEAIKREQSKVDFLEGCPPRKTSNSQLSQATTIPYSGEEEEN